MGYTHLIDWTSKPFTGVMDPSYLQSNPSDYGQNTNIPSNSGPEVHVVGLLRRIQELGLPDNHGGGDAQTQPIVKDGTVLSTDVGGGWDPLSNHGSNIQPDASTTAFNGSGALSMESPSGGDALASRLELSQYPGECVASRGGELLRPPVIWRGTILRNDKRPIYMGLSILFGDVGSYVSRQGSTMNIKHKIKFADVPIKDVAGIFAVFLDIAESAQREYSEGSAMFQDYINFFMKKERAGIVQFESDPVLGPGMLYLIPSNMPQYQEVISFYNLPVPTNTGTTLLGVLEMGNKGE